MGDLFIDLPNMLNFLKGETTFFTGYDTFFSFFNCMLATFPADSFFGKIFFVSTRQSFLLHPTFTLPPFEDLSLFKA